MSITFDAHHLAANPDLTNFDRIDADGFRPDADIETVELTEFLTMPTEGVSEYIHVYPDDENREVRFYRAVEDAGSKRLMTVVSNARFKVIRHDGKTPEEPRGFFLGHDEANTLMTFLMAYKFGESHSPTRVNISFTPNAGRGMMDDQDVVEETLRFTYNTESGRSNTVAITSLKKNVMQSLARY